MSRFGFKKSDGQISSELGEKCLFFLDKKNRGGDSGEDMILLFKEFWDQGRGHTFHLYSWMNIIYSCHEYFMNIFFEKKIFTKNIHQIHIL